MATPLANTGGTAASALPAAGGTSESTLSSWAGPYVTNMLGKAQAVANEPYQVYQGPMTAGQSNLQSKVFQGLGGLSFPGNLGQSFSSGMGQPQQRGFGPGVNNFGGPVSAGPGAMPPGGDVNLTMPYMGGGNNPNIGMQDLMGGTGGGMQLAPSVSRAPRTEDDWKNFSSMASYAPGTDMEKEKANFLAGGQGGGPVSAGLGAMPQQGIAGLQPPQGSQQPSNIAQSYMNPYLQSVLNPQMDELRRQNEITNMQANAKLTGAGAFGGGRQAIMNAENARNLMQEQNKTVGQGYASAYDKAMGQFNTEQGQSKDLVNMLANAGQAERGIEQEGITADYNEFLAQRDDPMKKTQYLQSMLQGLPYQTVTNSPLGKSGMGQLAEITGSLPSVEKTLRDLGLLPPA